MRAKVLLRELTELDTSVGAQTTAGGDESPQCAIISLTALWTLTGRSVVRRRSAASRLATNGAILGLCYGAPPHAFVAGSWVCPVHGLRAAAFGTPVACDSAASSFACVGSTSGVRLVYRFGALGACRLVCSGLEAILLARAALVGSEQGTLVGQRQQQSIKKLGKRQP